MPLPNFLILGAAKAGTTALYNYLNQHPEIAMSNTKETNFFALEGQKAAFTGPGDDRTINRHSVTKLADYERQFKPGAQTKAIGEACTMYLYDPRTIEGIRRHVPQARLIAILREPIGRAFSAYVHMLRDQREPEADFLRALQDEERRIAAGWEHIWHYKAMGMYSEQLQRYLAAFGRDQIRIYLYDDLRRDGLAVMRDIYGFIGVDQQFEPDIAGVSTNVSGIPRNRTLHLLLSKPNPIKGVVKSLLPQQQRRTLAKRLKKSNLTPQQISDDARDYLADAFYDEINRLEELIGRDLSGWQRYRLASSH